MRSKGECATVCELIIDGGKKMKNQRRKMQDRGKESVLRRFESLISLANGETHCISLCSGKKPLPLKQKSHGIF